ncbi:3-dehydroquinate synthase [Sphingosinicella sp. LY1275]|uniref:3-dehydroquinate synthase n=1 Tax=Sphingosinicella sp. LY1275 TaxID=3095379 RepID=UPI002ADEC4E3|nr:3-dehydroquinate synthase [Sphingosinicella sp. LY1275]MEA1015527.1 3-dehydroquinate synthase [Sphingosinicella sp. LY1275]
MTMIPVALGERSYEVRIEEGALERAADHLARFARDGRLVVVTDENVWAAQGERLRRGLGAIQAVPIVLPPGEGSKSWSTLAGLIDRLLGARLERSDHLVAFGGGVIGDLAGFAASILNRGIAFVQIPTSLLAQVDSSVGGKTGINVPAGKNLVGAFHQPSLVLIDPLVLDTLDPRQLRAGYAEIVKYALIEDAPFFDWLESNGPALLAGDAEARRHAIATSVAGKAGIVARDERETAGVRALLNLGHTFGHALEAEAGFSDRLLHGEAVAAGMALAFAFSAERGLCPGTDAERVRTHLATVGLPTGLREAGISATGQKLVDHMMLDKKKEAGRIPFILAHGIGQAFVDREVALADVAAFLDRQG